MRRRHTLSAVVSILALTAACTREDEAPRPPVEPTEGPVVAAGAPVTYACEQGGAVTVAYPDAATAQVTHDGQTYAMRQEGAASGALFVGAGMTWRTVVAEGMETSTLSRRAPNGGVEVAVVARCSRPAPPLVTAPPLTSAPPVEGGVLPAAAPCRAAQLTLVSHSGDAGAGNRMAVLAMQNTGAQPCSLGGYPGVVLRDRQGRDLTAIRAEPTPRGVAEGAQPAPVNLPAQGRAFFDIAWTVVPDETKGQRACPAVTGLRVTAPGDPAALPLNLTLSPCGGRVRVSPFRATPEPAPVLNEASAASAGVQTARKTA
jgi:membrane-bound inhibitor of C-type lysozyme